MRTCVTVAAVAALEALVVAGSGNGGPVRTSAPGFIGPYTGVGTGGVDRYHHLDNQSSDPANHIVSDSNDAYRGRFLYSFRIDNGVISGIGNGVYRSATWHLQGTNGDEGSFSCDIPMTTQDYSVRITGYAASGLLFLRFALNDDAVERNDDYYCGANYTGYATTSHYLQESLDKAMEAQPGGFVVTDQHHPRIGHLGYNAVTGPQNDRRVATGEWDLTIAPPSRTTEPTGSDGGPASSSRRNRSTRMCTIQGTGRRDVLVGTRGRDVICGLGGNDVIRALGGNDLVFGGLGSDTINGGAGIDSLYGNNGRDTFTAKDGARDTVLGGRGRDSARIDRGKDRTSSVERVR